MQGATEAGEWIMLLALSWTWSWKNSCQLMFMIKFLSFMSYGVDLDKTSPT